MYKYLLFDLDETLLDFKKAEAVAITETLKSFGIKATRETVELYSAINLSCWKRYEKGEITRDEIYKNRVELLGESLGVAFDADSFTNKYSDLLSYQGHLYPYAIFLCRRSDYLRSFPNREISLSVFPYSFPPIRVQLYYITTVI